MDGWGARLFRWLSVLVALIPASWLSWEPSWESLSSEWISSFSETELGFSTQIPLFKEQKTRAQMQKAKNVHVARAVPQGRANTGHNTTTRKKQHQKHLPLPVHLHATDMPICFVQQTPFVVVYVSSVCMYLVSSESSFVAAWDSFHVFLLYSFATEDGVQIEMSHKVFFLFLLPP